MAALELYKPVAVRFAAQSCAVPEKSEQLVRPRLAPVAEPRRKLVEVPPSVLAPLQEPVPSGESQSTGAAGLPLERMQSEAQRLAAKEQPVARREHLPMPPGSLQQA